jgi:hypothetical protein
VPYQAELRLRQRVMHNSVMSHAKHAQQQVFNLSGPAYRMPDPYLFQFNLLRQAF